MSIKNNKIISIMVFLRVLGFHVKLCLFFVSTFNMVLEHDIEETMDNLLHMVELKQKRQLQH